MTIGVGGSTAEAELAAMRSLRGDAPAIGIDERMARIARAQALMRDMLITETGARWFTEPAHSVDDPFGYEA